MIGSRPMTAKLCCCDIATPAEIAQTPLAQGFSAI